MKLTSAVVILFTLALTSCAHHRDVRPGVEGIHTVNLQSSEVEQGSREAISQANHFCKQRGLTAAFVSEEKKYNGSMNEKDYNTARTVGKVAQVVGGGLYTLGGHKGTRNAGGVAGLGGTAVNTAIGEGYNVQMKFKCL